MRRPRTQVASRSAVLALVLAVVLLATAAAASAKTTGRWLAGDIQTHTSLTDGNQSNYEVARQAFGVYGLDYLANAEPGGTSAADPSGLPFSLPVWRWVTLADYSYPVIQDLRESYPERALVQGLEWNAPNHQHVNVGIVGAANEPSGISAFEYHFDAKDTDVSRANEGTKEVSHMEQDPAFPDDPTKQIKVVDVPAAPFAKINTVKAQPGDPDNTIVGAQWLEDNFPSQSYAIVAHPSQSNLWSVGDFRALNDAAPDVAFGMQGLPGRQDDFARGGYGAFINADGTVGTLATADAALTDKARTYGGADYMTAKVGGLWDALLGEGRHFWIFNDSEFYKLNKSYKDASNNTIGIQNFSFWPGQYAKTWTFARRDTPQAVVDGMRSGNVFVADGDLIDGLKFKVKSAKKSFTIGQTFRAKPGQVVTVVVSVHSPAQNENGDRPVVNHIDLIAGNVTGRISSSSPDYATKDTNSSTHVIKTFTKSSWKRTKGGWKTMTVRVKATANMYFRLRGTNLAANTPNETDASGNPLKDELSYTSIPNPIDGGATMTAPVNTAALAWTDLWFYSNPVFLTAATPAK
jgi:hypothetical protein